MAPCVFVMVPRVRFELTRPKEHCPLKTACLPFHHLGTKLDPSNLRAQRQAARGRTRSGRGGRTRTRDTRIWRPMLYQLSYTPARFLWYQPGPNGKTYAARRLPPGCQGWAPVLEHRGQRGMRVSRGVWLKLKSVPQRSQCMRSNILPSTNFRFQAGVPCRAYISCIPRTSTNDACGSKLMARWWSFRDVRHKTQQIGPPYTRRHVHTSPAPPFVR